MAKTIVLRPPINVGDTVKFNGQDCKIVDKTENLLAIDVVHKYQFISDGHEIVWVMPDWIQ